MVFRVNCSDLSKDKVDLNYFRTKQVRVDIFRIVELGGAGLARPRWAFVHSGFRENKTKKTDTT